MDKYSFDRFIKQKDQGKKKNILRLIVTFLGISAISYVFIFSGLFKENNTAYYIFIGIFATLVAYFNGYFKAPKQELDGVIDGKITFTKKDITVGTDKYDIQNIQLITIHNNDYVGKKEKDFGEFEKEKGSFGVNNQIILDLGNKNFVEADFRQQSENEFEKMKSILIAYHQLNKISFDDLISILKVEYDIDKNELKRQISKEVK